MTLSEFDTWYRMRYHHTSSAIIAIALVFSDLIAVMLSFGTGFFVVNLYDHSIINFKSFVTYWPYVPVFLLIFQLYNLYPGVSLAPSEEFKCFTTASFMVHGGIILSRFIENQQLDAISAAFAISFVFSTFVLLMCRSATHYALRKKRLGGIPAVIYGSGALGKLVIDRLLDSVKCGYVPVLILSEESEADAYRGVPILYDLNLGEKLVRRYNIKMAIVAMQGLNEQELTRLLNYSVSAFRYNVLIPDFFRATNIWMTVRDFDGLLGFVTSHRLKMDWNLAIKRFMDIVITIIVGLVILPVLLLLALVVKVSSPGPVLYGHSRLGCNGTPFKAYKFRSMVIDADALLQRLLAENPTMREEWEASHKIKNDPRVTKVGRFLRRTSLDEFPQLINVLKGEMSLVGPRPIVQDEVPKYGEDFKRIFSVKPGLSGLWQVSGRSDTDYNERVLFDTYYLQSWSVWLDIWILYQTIVAVFRGRGAY
ncbi:MAG: undecaprenyl-phosphate galactose phosphotransferase WbaP [Treponema sp.]|jgi:Undecaprenyl-phosphate galactose phosphotransferase WbaP|nr:undecaprenyl-phosphate galactose phosphotransferase WbaP [Treponema sp.]